MLGRKIGCEKATRLVVVLALLLACLLGFAFGIQEAKAGAVIFIRSDGSVDPLNEPIQRSGDSYVFLADIFDSIVVERDNIVIDGNGYSLVGSGEGAGLCLSGRQNVTVRGFQIENFAYGISLGGLGCSSSYNIIIENKITANTCDGIYLDYYSNYNSITGNSISKNNNGIYLYCSSSNSIGKNNVTGNEYAGIFLSYSSSQNDINHNYIANNWYGISIEHSSNNIIYYNDFINIAQQVSSSASINVWNKINPSLGNFWSEYKGTDNNGDGIGDKPYNINPENNDKFPLMTPTNGNSSTSNINNLNNQPTTKPTVTPTPTEQENQPLVTLEPEATFDEENTQATPLVEELSEGTKRELEGFVWFIGITVALIGMLLLLVRRRVYKRSTGQ